MAAFLLTGVRLPYAIDLARNLARHGHRVVAADSIRFPVGRHTRAVRAFHRVPAPRTHWTAFRREVLDIVQAEAVDHVVPTCEEVAYVARLKPSLPPRCRAVCADFELHARLHSKAGILELAAGCGIGLPRTEVVDAAELTARAADLSDRVVKPEYSRFGTDVLLGPDAGAVAALVARTGGALRYLIQERIRGVEYFSYNIAHAGRLRLHVTYQPVHRFRHGPSVYFRPVRHEAVARFAEAFVRRHRFSGQISFDLMDDGSRPYLIECNPRTSNGLHLAAATVDLGACLTAAGPLTTVTAGDAMIGGAMVMIGLPPACAAGNLRGWWRDYRRARNVISAPGDPVVPGYQFLSACEFLLRAARERVSFAGAATWDIDWNGQELEA